MLNYKKKYLYLINKKSFILIILFADISGFLG